MSGNAYDALAPHYRDYARSRAAYCEAVDRWVCAWRPPRVSAMLDVGSGDGGRAVRLARALDADRLVLSDPSVPMVALCREHDRVAVLQCAAEALPLTAGPFDAMTSLWNVLAHVDGHAARLAALRRMASILAPRGRLFLDVHNRYNAATAGRRRVVRRLLRDYVRPAEANGVVPFTWEVGGIQIPASGYLFAPAEIQALFDAAGLVVVGRAWVNYADGSSAGPWSGQMLFVLERQTG